MEEAAYGKLYVRGHDREGRPIIYFNPGQERSFDTEKVCFVSLCCMRHIVDGIAPCEVGYVQEDVMYFSGYLRTQTR